MRRHGSRSGSSYLLRRRAAVSYHAPGRKSTPGFSSLRPASVATSRPSGDRATELKKFRPPGTGVTFPWRSSHTSSASRTRSAGGRQQCHSRTTRRSNATNKWSIPCITDSRCTYRLEPLVQRHGKKRVSVRVDEVAPTCITRDDVAAAFQQSSSGPGPFEIAPPPSCRPGPMLATSRSFPPGTWARSEIRSPFAAIPNGDLLAACPPLAGIDHSSLRETGSNKSHRLISIAHSAGRR